MNNKIVHSDEFFGEFRRKSQGFVYLPSTHQTTRTWGHGVKST